MCKLTYLTAFCLLYAGSSFAQKRGDFKTLQRDTFYGKVVEDPYRKLEDTSDVKVKAWMKSEAEKANAFLTAMPGRKVLIEQIKTAFESQKVDEIDNINFENGKFYVTKRNPGQENFNLYRIDKNGKQTLLLDPKKAHPEIKSTNINLAGFDISNPPYLYHSLIVAGDEGDRSSFLLNMKTGKDETFKISLAKTKKFLFFDPDRTDAFYYYHVPLFKQPGVAPIHWYDNVTIGYHIIGTDTTKDKTIIGLDTSVIKRSQNILPFLYIPKGQSYIFVIIKNKVGKQYRIYVTPKKDFNGVTTHWRKLTDFDDQVNTFECARDYLYVISQKDAPNSKVLRISLRDGTFSNAVTLIPNKKNVLINDLAVTNKQLLVTETDNGQYKLLGIPYTTNKATAFKLPLTGNAEIAWADYKENTFIVKITSWVKLLEYYTYNPATGKFNPSVVQTYHYHNPTPLEVKDVLVKSHDGVMVPMTIVYKKGLKLDGTHPVILNGYGAYGDIIEPHFFQEYALYHNYGGIHAYAQVRGGGINGEEWRLGGNKETKPNTWKDFIACAEYLIANKYATSKNLVGSGASAGGVLIGRAITERPDLFAGAIIGAPCLDMIRSETSLNGYGNIPEFGSVKTEKGFNALFEMSTYHHVKNGTKYPAILFYQGVNDTRVPVWHTLKTAALIQDATSSGAPVLIRLDYDSGHGLQQTESMIINSQADNYSFIFWNAGLPGFKH